MMRAGTAAAEVMLRQYAHRLTHGVAVYVGSGNNGGDAYIVAAQLARAGVRVRLSASAPPRTVDAERALSLALPRVSAGAPTGDERLVVDGLLGMGHRGELRDPIAASCVALARARRTGATIVALDVPSGLDATTGEIAAGTVAADCTLSFGTLKRGQLISRAHVGALQLLDIGLGEHAQGSDAAWRITSARTIAARVPIAWNAHKGTRGHVALVGGALGMTGAIMLAARAALHSGCGLARAWVDGAGVVAVQQAVPQAITRAWPTGIPANDADDSIGVAWGDALALGPGLGRTDTSRALLERALRENHGVPVVLDADALSLLADVHGKRVPDALREIAQHVPALVVTPHAGEFARLSGAPTPVAWQARSDALKHFATQSRATVLLKGTPTLIATPDSDVIDVVARGTAILATGGSGDMLTGIIAALLAQGAAGEDAAILAANVHGRAAEMATNLRTLRGPTLDDVLHGLPNAWREIEREDTEVPSVLATFPSLGGPV